jgi:hypothetical protein
MRGTQAYRVAWHGTAAAARGVCACDRYLLRVRADIYEDEAQGVRWGYWCDGVGHLHPYCIECATRESRRTLLAVLMLAVVQLAAP